MRRQVHAGGICEVLVNVRERARGSEEIVHSLVQTFGGEPILFGAQLCVQSRHVEQDARLFKRYRALATRNSCQGVVPMTEIVF